ncbi:hypothetical protein [Hamadaea tsunoensis]|uniref:hypothetical protein n=1 Tax=Hamadaea tsunoensis TaxID=53368 RepID=UPI000416FAA4|nr:hypothetical protein [Hamadaea tsunoensis]
MRVINVGAFLLPVRFSLVGMMSGDGRDRVSQALTRRLTDFDVDRALFETQGLFLDVQRSAHQRMETMVFSGAAEIEGAGFVRLYISSLAVGFVVCELDVPDDLVLDLEDEDSCDRFKAYETPVTEVIEPLIGRWCREIVDAVDPALLRPVPKSALDASSLLWWHRICVDGAPEVEFPGARWYGVSAQLTGNADVQVGTGVTNLHTGGRTGLVNDVIEGLMIATQEWLVVDEAKRHIAELLLALSANDARNLITMETQYVDVLALTEDVTLRNLLLKQESRYLTAPRRRISQAASAAWNTTEEAQGLEERTAALRDLFTLHRERIFNNRDERRNRLIFVFTAVTLIQSVLVWYDFLTSDANAVGGAPRPLIAMLVLLATLISVVSAVASRPRARRRLREVAIPRQRDGAEPVKQVTRA